MVISGMAYDWDNVPIDPEPGPTPCVPIDTSRFEIVAGEAAIAIFDSLGGQFQVRVDGILARPLTMHPIHPYSATVIPFLALGTHEVIIEVPGACQSGFYVCALKPEPAITTTVWSAPTDTGNGSGSDAANAIGFERFKTFDVNTSQVSGEINLQPGTRLMFVNGIYNRADRLKALLIRTNDIELQSQTPGGAIFTGEAAPATWTLESDDIYSTPLIDPQTNYNQIIDDGIRIPFWNTFADLQGIVTGRAGWTVDANKLYAKLLDRTQPDALTIVARGSRAFQVTTPAMRVKFSGLTIKHFRKRAISAQDVDFIHIAADCRFEFIHSQAIFLSDCPEPKVLATFIDDNSIGAWWQMKTSLPPYYTPSAQGTEGVTSLVVQTSSVGPKTSRFGFLSPTFFGCADCLNIRDEGPVSLTFQEVGGDYQQSYDNSIVDNRVSICNLYIGVTTLGHEGFAEDSDGYGPIFLLQYYGRYGYENPPAIDPEVNQLTEVAYKRKGIYNQTIMNQCTWEPFHDDPNTQMVHVATEAIHNWLEISNCISIGQKIHDHDFQSNILADSNVHFVYTPESNPYRWGSINYSDLVAWQVATGFDTNTVAMDPMLDSSGVPTVQLPPAAPNPLNTHGNRGAY